MNKYLRGMRHTPVSRKRSLGASAQTFIDLLEARYLLSQTTMQLVSTLHLSSGLDPVAVVTADFNGDGKLDLAVADANTSGSVGDYSVYLGNGNDTFTALSTRNTAGHCTDLAIGYFNADTIPDLVIAEGNSGAVVELGNGDGSFGAPIQLPTSSGHSIDIEEVTAFDYNDDGYDDVAATNLDGPVEIIRSNGNGTFTSVGSIGGNFNSNTAAGDFNHDSDDDLVLTRTATNAADSVSIEISNGNGTFTDTQDLPSTETFAARVAYVNSDNSPDVLVGSVGEPAVDVYLNNGSGHFTKSDSHDVGFTDDIGTGHFQYDDSRNDFTATDFNGSLDTFINNGGGTFSDGSSVSAPESAGGIATGDFNSDGGTDVAITDSNDSKVLIYAPVEAYPGGNPPTAEATIQAENYDNGGEGATYHDRNTQNFGGLYRSGGVDIYSGGTQYVVGATQPGEWLQYTLDVVSDEDGPTKITATVNPNGATDHIHYTLDGSTVGGSSITIPASNSYEHISSGTFNLSAGPHVLRVYLDSSSSSLLGNFDYFNFTAQPTGGFISGKITGGKVGEVIYLDKNNDSKLDNNEDSISTDDPSGGYSFSNVPAGSYIIRQVLPSGYTQTTPSNNGGIHVTVKVGGVYTNENFTDKAPSSKTASIAGTVFSDSDGNGKQNGSEGGVNNVELYLDTNNDNKQDNGETIVHTDSHGKYSFNSLAAGSYIVRAVTPTHYKQTSPSSNGGQHITLTTGQKKTGVLFGEKKIS